MKKKILYISLVVVAIVAALLAYYHYWTRTPEYSLKQIAESIRKHDVDTFNKYVDVNTFFSRFIDDILEVATNEQSAEETDVWYELGQEISKGLVNLLKPRITEILKEQLERYIETADFPQVSAEEEKSEISLPNLKAKYGGDFRDLQYVKKEGKIAYIGIGLYNERVEKVLTVELKFRGKEEGHWQLIELSNFFELSRELKKFEKEKLEAYWERNRPERNREAVKNDLLNLASRAQQFYRRPAVLGGGGNSFVGLTADAAGYAKISSMDTNANGSYAIINAGTATTVVFRGIGVEIGNDGTNPVMVTMDVFADSKDVRTNAANYN